jgi:class 3 adenylate cyclase
VNPPISRFCNNCGNDILISFDTKEVRDTSHPSQHTPTKVEPISLTEGERHQATIVFSDLSGYTPMNEKLDPEEVEAIMSRIKMEAVRIVESHEGIVNQFVGDEVLALFGIPFAHEDDPVRAAKAAFEIHELVRKISPKVEERIDTKLRMHTGISTGLVVTHIRDIREGSYGITGDTVNIGARLASKANIDEILVGPETHSLISPYFETKRFAEVTVRGKTKPIIPYRVMGKLAVKLVLKPLKKWDSQPLPEESTN